MSAAPDASAMPGALIELTAGAPRHAASMAAAVAAMRPELPNPGSWPAATEKTCLALAIYHEARGEAETGQKAVARVILNRTRSRVYPSSICGVVFQNAHRKNRCQFSFACDDLPDLAANPRSWSRSLDVAAAMLCASGCPVAQYNSPAGGFVLRFRQATHYHATHVTPVWASKLTPLGRIGDHLFYASDRVLKKSF